MKRALPILLIALFASAPPAHAWGEKGHYIVNEAATMGMTTDMPHFFYKVRSYIGFVAMSERV